MQRFFKFWRRCAQNAFWGNAPFANDWQWLIGYPVVAVILAAVGYFYAELSGKIELTLTNGALGALIAALAAYVVTWLAAFVVRLLNQPVLLFDEQRRQIDTLLGKARSSTAEIEASSFGLGYEFSKFDEEEHQYSLRGRHELLRIWVENLSPRPLNECRVVVEKIQPQASITNGALLIPDQRGAEQEPSAAFHLAVTERRYFKFLGVREEMFAPFGEPEESEGCRQIGSGRHELDIRTRPQRT